MTGPSHVLSPSGWVEFEAWDPAAVDAVKDLLEDYQHAFDAGSLPPTNECPGAACDGPGRGQHLVRGADSA